MVRPLFSKISGIAVTICFLLAVQLLAGQLCAWFCALWQPCPVAPLLHPAGHLSPGPAAADAIRPLLRYIRPRRGVLVADLDQDPPPVAGPGQAEPARQLRAVQAHRQMPRLVPDDLGRALVPDDDRAGAAALPWVHALEVASGQLMIIYPNGQPPDCRVHRRPLGHRPPPEHPSRLDPEVIMQPGRVVQLHHEPGFEHGTETTGASFATQQSDHG